MKSKIRDKGRYLTKKSLETMSKGRHLITKEMLENKSKNYLIRIITGYLSTLPKKAVVRIAYNILKTDLPRLRTTKQKSLPKRKTKRKFSKKQLAAQRLFTKRAKAGTFRRKQRRARGKRRFD